MAQTLGEAELLLSVDASRLNAGLNQAQQQAQRAGQGIQGQFQQAARGIDVFTDATQRSGAGAGFFKIQMDELVESAKAYIGAATAAAAIKFTFDQIKAADEAGAAVRTLGVDSDKLKSSLRKLSDELDASISTLDLLKASYDVASSGFADAASATQILRAAAAGAKGGFADINDVAKGATAVLNAYGLTAADATRVVDGFVQAQADGVLTVRQYVDNIGEIVSVGAAAGISIEELNAAIATATLKGVQVNQAFTGFRQVISSILKPSKEATDLAKSLGIDYSLAGLQAKGFAGFLKDVAVKTGAAADKTAILLGSVEAQAALQPLLNDQLATYIKLLENQAKASGVAAAASDKVTDTISGNLDKIKNRFSNIALSIDSETIPVLKTNLGIIGAIVSAYDKLLSLGSGGKSSAGPFQAVPNTLSAVAQLFGPGGSLTFLQQFLGQPFLDKVISGPMKQALKDLREFLRLLPGSKPPEPPKPPETPADPRFPEASEANAALWERVKQEREAAAKTDAKLKGEIEKASKAAADNLRDAAERVKQAAQSLRGAREGFASAVGQQFNIATNQQRQRAREILEQQVRAAERARAFDPSRVSARFGVPQTAGGLDLSSLTFRQLERLAQQTGTLANAEASLQGAVTENTKALQALAARRWEVLVNVRNNASGATTVDYQNALR